MAAAFRPVDAGNGVGTLRPDARAGTDRWTQSQDVQFVSGRIEAVDREHRRVQRDRPGCASGWTDLPPCLDRRYSVDLPAARGGGRSPSEGPGRGDFIAGAQWPSHWL